MPEFESPMLLNPNVAQRRKLDAIKKDLPVASAKQPHLFALRAIKAEYVMLVCKKERMEQAQSVRAADPSGLADRAARRARSIIAQTEVAIRSLRASYYALYAPDLRV